MGPGPQLLGLQQQMVSLTVTPEAPGEFIAALKKLYTGDDQKFRVSRYEVLNFKLRDFYKACNIIRDGNWAARAAGGPSYPSRRVPGSCLPESGRPVGTPKEIRVG
jgi:hypothetical protein